MIPIQTTMTPKKFLRIIALLAAIGGLGLAPARAQLARYDFKSAVPTPVAKNVTGSPAAWSGLRSGNFGIGSISQSAYARFDNLGEKLDPEKYLTFTLTAAPGYVLNLSSITINIGGSNSNTVARTAFLQIRSNAEAKPFTTSLPVSPGATTETGVLLPIDTPNPSYFEFTIDLSGEEFQGRPHITFRIYAYGSTAVSTAFWRADNLMINGAVTLVGRQ